MTEVALGTLVASDHVTPATRRALTDRLDPTLPWPDPRVFTDHQRATLTAVALRLVPEVDDMPRPDLAKAFEYRLASPEGKGWRYANLPIDAAAQRELLDLIETQSQATHGRQFGEVPDPEQDVLLRRLQSGESSTPLGSARAFEDMLAALAECLATDPAFLVAISYVGFADRPGWERIGLNQRDDREIVTATTDG